MATVMIILSWLRSNWKLVIFITACLFLIGIGWHLRATKCEAARQAEINRAVNAAVSDQRKKQGEADRRAKKLEDELARQRELAKHLNVRLENEIHHHDVYRDCKPTSDGLRTLNSTIDAR